MGEKEKISNDKRNQNFGAKLNVESNAIRRDTTKFMQDLVRKMGTDKDEISLKFSSEQVNNFDILKLSTTSKINGEESTSTLDDIVSIKNKADKTITQDREIFAFSALFDSFNKMGEGGRRQLTKLMNEFREFIKS